MFSFPYPTETSLLQQLQFAMVTCSMQIGLIIANAHSFQQKLMIIRILQNESDAGWSPDPSDFSRGVAGYARLCTCTRRSSVVNTRKVCRRRFSSSTTGGSPGTGVDTVY